MNQSYPLSELPAPWNQLARLGTRLFVWAIFFLLLYILRSFFLLIFLTFVFAYIQNHGVSKLETIIGNRSLRVTLVGLLLLAVLLSVGAFLVPKVRAQAELLADSYAGYLQTLDNNLIELSNSYPFINTLIPGLEESVIRASENPEGKWSPKNSPSSHLVNQLLGLEDTGGSEDNLNQALSTMRNIGKTLVAIGSAFFLSLLFSFLIVLDLPRLGRSVTTLALTKLGFIYDEVAENIYQFGKVLGQTLEAQLFIALANTALTALIIYYLDIEQHLAFLSVIVFLCSFIPVAGVFFSSVPICLLVLEHSGFSGVVIAALLIWLVHLVEAYILNPRIFGHRLRVNPVLVLIILTVGGKLFNVWGLILGLPVCTYFFGHAIQYREPVSKDESA